MPLSVLSIAVQRVLQPLVLRFLSTPSKDLEIIVLRHQLAVLHRHVRCPVFRSAFTVTPATLFPLAPALGGEALDLCPPTGRSSIAPEVRALIVRFARENPRWGYQRIVGELKGLGILVSATTVKKILRDEGLGPTSQREAFMASIPVCASRKHPRGGFLHRRYGVAPAIVCAVLH